MTDFLRSVILSFLCACHTCISVEANILKLSNCAISETTISAPDDLFVVWGLPETIVSDNGPQFTSHTFADWFNAHSIAHLIALSFHRHRMVKLNALLVFSNRP